MRRKDWKKADWMAWGHGASTATADGYLRPCRFCGQRIYMKLDHDGQWRPYESWVDGNVEEGEWQRHECGR